MNETNQPRQLRQHSAMAQPRQMARAGRLARWAHPARFALLAGAIATPAMAQAQAAMCRPATDFRMPRVETPGADQVRRTPVTRYLLTYSWSPQHCYQQARRGGGGDDDMQCGGQSGQFGFVLHGLWPESTGSNWPQYCRPGGAVSRATIQQNLCMTPSPQLLQHEWQKHGTCMSASPEDYFRTAAQLHANVRFPDMTALAARRDVTAGELRRLFSAANTGIPTAALAIEVTRGGWLDEVRIDRKSVV